MKVALIYDRVNKWGGAERVLLALHEIFPDAPLYTAVYSSNQAPWAKVFPKVISTFLQKVPFAKTQHEFLGAFTPIAFEKLDLTGVDLVISVTSEAAKGVITRPPTRHICYCLTPTRYLWSAHDYYFKNPPSMLGKIPFFYHVSRPFVYYARNWDKIAAQRPDMMIAISSAVKKRIKKYYGRDSQIIFPPVEVDKFKNQNLKIKNQNFKSNNFFLIVSRLVPYKRVDLAVEVFNELGLPLVIVGQGSEKGRLKSMAKDNIRFIDYLTEAELGNYYKKCTAFIFPQEEDFGIAAVEAQAAGRPVIAYKAGGALDTVIEGETGVFFKKQDVQSLINAVGRFKNSTFDRRAIIKNAERFSKERFKREFFNLVKSKVY